jgi:glutathione S-transferase
MWTLFGSDGSGSAAVEMALQRCGVPYRVQRASTWEPDSAQAALRLVNPMGQIPTLQFDDGQVMTESAAICQYLADKVGALRVLPGDPGYGDYLNFLHQSDATLTFPQTLVLRYTLLEKPENRNPKVASDYRRWFIARTIWAERALADGRPWLCGDEFTVADIAVAYALLLAGNLGHLGEVGPHLLSYWERCQARDGFQRAKAAQTA